MRLPAWTIAAAVLSASLPGCSTIPASPATVSDRTILDERVGIGAELAYTTATKLGTVLATAGLIDKEKFKALDRDAYTSLRAVRAGYQAGNAKVYADSITRVQEAVRAINQLVEANREPR